MSKHPLSPTGILFSAEHISKWNVLPEDTRLRVARSSSTSDDDDDDTQTRELPIHTPTHARMAVRTHTWISLWFLLSAPVVIWDATYCFFRPRSMFGGDLHWIWAPYVIYQNVDYVYGLKAIEENSGFPNAQSFLNVVETALNVAYLYLAHISGWPGAPLIGFATATMTLSKTVLYGAQEYFCGWCAVGHNTWFSFLFYWVFTNGLWILFPGMIVWRLGGDIVDSLCTASQDARKAVSRKTE